MNSLAWTLMIIIALFFIVSLVGEEMACRAKGGAYVRTIFWYECVELK